MIALIDTSLWVDFFRPRSSARLKHLVSAQILDTTAHIAEPIVFEILRNALPSEVAYLTSRFQSLPLLPTPDDLWQQAGQLGQACRRRGHTAGALDLLIGAVAREHRAVLITLDEDFEKIGETGGFQVKLLRRPEG